MAGLGGTHASLSGRTAGGMAGGASSTPEPLHQQLQSCSAHELLAGGHCCQRIRSQAGAKPSCHEAAASTESPALLGHQSFGVGAPKPFLLHFFT